MATYFGFEPKNVGPYLFISYNTEDASRIAPIVKDLHVAQIPMWYDRALNAGAESWEQQIAEKIESCEGLLMFITKGIFKKSRDSFVHVEYKLARMFSDKPIYVVLLDKIERNEIPMDMRIWWVELMSNQCIICSGEESGNEKADEILRNLKPMMQKYVPFMESGRKMQLRYSVDIVFCICGTPSMAPYLENIKKTCIRFPNMLCREMQDRGKTVSQLRSRLIVFQSYANGNDRAMMVTEFFDMPQNSSDYQDAVHSIRCEDAPMHHSGSNALEALAYAIRSKWEKTDGRKRQVIILWTNEGIVPLGAHREEKFYPGGMAKDMDQLRNWWYEMDRSGRRLIVFAPNEPSHALYQISEWDRSIIMPISLSAMTDDTYSNISRMICASI